MPLNFPFIHIEYVNFCKVVDNLFQRDFKIKDEQRLTVLCITKSALCAQLGEEEMEITSHPSEKTSLGNTIGKDSV